MIITPPQITQLGTLARLELTAEEIIRLAEQLPKILAYVSQLQRLDTTTVAESQRPTANLRPDLAQSSVAIKQILAQAPERTGWAWKVDAVFS